MIVPYLLFALVFVGPGVSVTPTYVDRYASHDDCEQAGKDIRLTMPPSDKVLYWSMCVRAGTTLGQPPSAPPDEALGGAEPVPPPAVTPPQRKVWGR